MADWGQDDAVIAPAKTTPPKESWGQDDAVIKVDIRGFGEKEPSKSSSSVFGDKVSSQTLSDLVTGKEPPQTTGLGTFAREAVLNVPATVAGIGVGEAVTAATIPVLGPFAPVAGLIAGGATAFGVNYLGEAGMDELEAMDPYAQRLMQLLGVDHNTRAAGRKEHEYAALGGQLASGGPFVSTAAKNVGQRLVGGGVNVGVGSGVRAAFGEDQDIKKSAMEFAAGVAMPGTLTKTGERIPGVRKTEPIPTPEVKKPTTPEEIEAFKAKVKEEQDRRKVDNERFKSLNSTVILKDGSKTSIETESSPNAFSTIGRMEHGEPISLIAKNEAGEEIGRLTYMPDGGPIDVFVREQDRRKGVANALYDAHKAAGGKLPPVESGMIISNDARALRASREAKALDLAYPNSDTHPINNDQIFLLKDNPWGKTILDKVTATGKSLEDFNAWLVNTLKSTRQVLFDEKHTEVPKELWNQMGELSPEEWSKKRGYSKEEIDSWNKNQKNVQQGVDEFGLNYDDIAGLINDPRDHPDYGTMWEKNTHPKQIDLTAKTSPDVAKAFEKVDPRSVPNEEEMIKHATDIHERFGEEEAIKFFEDYQKDLKERSIPVPNNMKELEDGFHKMNTFETKDSSEMVMWYESAKKAGVTKEQAEKWFFMLEDLRKLPDEVTKSGATDAKIRYWQSLIEGKKELPSDAKKIAASYDQYGREVPGSAEKKIKEWFDIIDKGRELPPEAALWLQEGRDELTALVRKAKAMGLDVGEEFFAGQSRVRLFNEKEKPGWKETLEEFFSNKMSFGDKVGEQAKAAMQRKVFQTSDGRVIELTRHPEDTKIKMPNGTYREVKKGTEVWEWKDGKKKLISHSPDLNLTRGDKIKVNKLPGELPGSPERTGSTRRVAEYEPTIIDGNVRNIEEQTRYKYMHDALASQALARMSLRKMVREAEFLENLKKSELFKQFAHGPDQDPKTLPSHYVQPKNIGMIPQLRGWAFDPKTAAIIDDFAKVWDNTMWMKATNAIVKNMMLNPIPHMFNEVMHLWNARGFTGWVDPRQLGTFASTARTAWRDVGNQTQFYRDIMREGGSVLGADPRNNKYFQAIQKEAQKQMFETPEMQRSLGQLAKKLGTTTLDLYNGISKASQKAMWFTRDVMYVQLIREVMVRQEKSTGVKMELKDAIAQAERHMPNYRMPSEVLNSRTIAKVLKNPNIDLFSRYHYGMVKSLVNTIKDIDPRNLKTPEGRAHFREGVDSMIAIGVAMGVLYPLMDAMASAVFGEDAEQRRAGPFHLLKAGLDVYEGKKDLSALIWPVFTFNPVLLTLGQLGLNKKIFTGKNIYNIDDSAKDIVGDIGTYVVKQVPQAPPIMSATAEEGGDTKLLARQFDIKVKTEEEKKREERALKAKAQKKKTRDTQRAKGTYNP